MVAVLPWGLGMARLAQGSAGGLGRVFRCRLTRAMPPRLGPRIAVIAVCTTLSALPPRAPLASCSPSVSLTYLPADFVCAVAEDFSSTAAATISTASKINVIVSTAATAPSTDRKALKVSLSKGAGDDGQPALVVDRPLTGSALTVYVAAVFEVSGWADPESQADNVIELTLNGTGVPPDTRLSLGLMTKSGSKLTPAIRVAGLSEGYVLGGDASLKSFQPTLLPNDADAPAKLDQGKFHTWEIRVTLNSTGSSNGEIAWAVDGSDVGAYGGFTFAPGLPTITEVRWVTLAHQALAKGQKVWLDNLYVATPPGTSQPDRIELANNTTDGRAPEPETATLMDAAVHQGAGTACVKDTVLHEDRSFTNLDHASALCDSLGDEIVVFSYDDAVAFDDGDAHDGVIWSSLTGERRQVTLGQRIKVPLVMWLTVRGIREKAEEDFKSTETLYNLNRAGVQFVVDEWNEVSDPQALAVIGGTCNANLQQVPTGAARPPYFRPGKINVYYVETMNSGENGLHCASVDPALDPGIIYMDDDHHATTLAHELGHAFALRDLYLWTNDNTSFPAGNIMVDRVDRSSFTLGQIYQVTLEDLSILNSSGARAGRSVSCDSRAKLSDFVTPAQQETPGTCPRISKDW